MMKGKHGKRYESAADFYELDGNIVMILTPDAAIDVCLTEIDHGMVVYRVEGGLWEDPPAFQVRRDCIWDGVDPPVTRQEAETNNREAAEYIRTKSVDHNAFVISAAPITGYPHKSGGIPE